MALPDDYEERVYAGVLGKLIGVYLGRPFEGWDHARIVHELGPIRGYVHERFGLPLVVTDDDVSGTFTFVRALEEHGFDPDLDARRIGDTWLNNIVERRTILWWGGIGQSTEETAWRRLRAGIAAPASGAIATNGRTVAEQIGAQIFIDGWAMVSPGNPGQAARLAREAASVSHDGEAVHAAVLLAVMESLAFVEPDIERLLEAGLGSIPEDCLVARVAADVRRWSAAHTHWEETRRLIAAHHGYDRYPGHCHVIPNHAVVLMALLHGQDDFDRAMLIANTAGWDTDCNAGNVGCLMGIRLGLAGLDRGTDWRGPLADRAILSSADGGGAITDAVQVAERLVRTGRRLAGEAVRAAPKEGARFHFSHPGSVQGFTARPSTASAEVGETADAELLNVADGRDGTRRLAIRWLRRGRTWFATTPTFMPADVDRMRTYDLLASPTLHPGQLVRGRVLAPAENDGPLAVAPVLFAYGEDDRPTLVSGPEASLEAGADHWFEWRVPDLGGWPIARVGISVTGLADAAAGTLLLDRLDWSGTPTVVLRRPDQPGRFWRRAFVDAVSLFETGRKTSFVLSQDQGRGLLIYGSRDWTAVRVEAAVAIHLGSGGVAASIGGLRRYTALMLENGRHLRLRQVRDGVERVLAETELAWRLDEPVRLALVLRDGVLVGEADGKPVLRAEAPDGALAGGAVGLVLDTGSLSADAISIAPP